MMERDCLLVGSLADDDRAWMHVALDFGGRGERKKDQMNVITNLANVKCRKQ